MQKKYAGSSTKKSTLARGRGVMSLKKLHTHTYLGVVRGGEH
jgi:hypothetical protein